MPRSARSITICAAPASPRSPSPGRTASNSPPTTPGRPRPGPLSTAFWRPARCGGAGTGRSRRDSSPEPKILARRCLARASSAAITSGMTEQLLPIGPADIDAAVRVIAPFAVRTPLLSFPVLNERVGAKVYLKPEMLQRTGSFKFRGAFNKVASIPQDKRAGGVVAFSSGNHAQGVAAAAKILDMQATIVMPADAPLSKRERTKSYGAEVVLYDRDRDDREAISRGIAEKRGATLVRPYDDPFVIAGQGTAGREIAEDMAALGLSPDIVVAPASGGGLIAGVATAANGRVPP